MYHIKIWSGLATCFGLARGHHHAIRWRTILSSTKHLKKYILFIYYFLWLCSPARAMASSHHEVSWSHTTTRHSELESSGTSDHLVAETSTWQHTQNKHPCTRWDSTYDRSRLAAVDPRLRRHGHWDRHVMSMLTVNNDTLLSNLAVAWE
jgi:hypothetical protein